MVEAVLLLYENDIIAGYLMFAQIAGENEQTELFEEIPYLVELYGFSEKEMHSAVARIVC